MKKNALISIIMAIVILVIVIIDTPKTNDNKDVEENNNNEEITTKILQSSPTYLLGGWNVQYKDIIHYEYDNDGLPLFNLYKQPSNLSFTLQGEALILEEEYPIINSVYYDQSFSLKIDSNLLFLFIEGKIIDDNKWEGYLEYVKNDENIYSKCRVVAKRIR